MKLKIGTRKSPLALWQAFETQKLLNANGFNTEIVRIVSEGDLKLKQPIYELGITGVFTKTLDIALVNGQIDLAVHSLKDVPTQLANGLHLTACLTREDHRDILVYKEENIYQKDRRTIATGSLRRKAFWLNRFPHDEMVDLRGNVQLRIKKLIENPLDAAVFAYAGLKRSEILSQLESLGLKYEFLNEMISAPSQGIVGIVSRNDLDLSIISDRNSAKAAIIERAFLRKLQGGCTAPIGCFAGILNKGNVKFSGAVLSLDGQNKIEIHEEREVSEPENFGIEMAEKCIAKGADLMIREIKSQLN